VRTLLADVDALMAETLTAIARDTRPAFDRMSALGEQSADRALRGAQVTIMPTAGLDTDLVTAA
jgi:hypothetical protein